jgi:hypothetical protein
LKKIDPDGCLLFPELEQHAIRLVQHRWIEYADREFVLRIPERIALRLELKARCCEIALDDFRIDAMQGFD